MLPTTTAYEHNVVDERGVPVLADTGTKVIEIVLDKLAYGWSAEEIHVQHPHLSLGQIYSALAYYWDHQDELDADIQRRLEFVEGLRKTAPQTSLQDRLRAQELLE